MGNYFDAMAGSWDKNQLKIERAKITAAKIKEVHFHSFNSFVDFGCGTGLLGIELKDTFTHIHLVDSSKEMLQVAQAKIAAANIKNIETHQATRLSELTAKYSAIGTLMTLHHIPDVNEFFTDACSILEDNGVMIIADLYAEDGSFHKNKPTFCGHNGFSIPALTTFAENAGFTVQSVEPYYEIYKENFDGIKTSYPLFLFVAKKSVQIN